MQHFPLLATIVSIFGTFLITVPERIKYFYPVEKQQALKSPSSPIDFSVQKENHLKI